MNRRTATWLAWSAFGVLAALVVVNLVLVRSASSVQTVGSDVPKMLSMLVYRLHPVGFAALGALVASRRPAHPIGWLMLSAAASVGIEAFVQSYAVYGLDSTHPLPGARWAGWVQNWFWTTSFISLFALLLVFPTGELASRAWRSVAWMCAVGALLIALTAAVVPGPIDGFPTIDNPVGVVGPLGELVVSVAPVAILVILLVMLVASGSSVVVRFWRARGVERQQLKWFAYAVAVTVAGFAVTFPGWLGSWGDLISNVCITSIPASIAVAVLRYRLYEIDRIINRTLVYAILSVGLGATYWLCIVMLQTSLRPLTQGSELAMVGSTLAVAAVFQPLRHRIQRLVDRRFYRQRYDAERILEAFNARLRDEIDLDSMGAELLAAVRQTMQPERLSLWLHSSAGRKS